MSTGKTRNYLPRPATSTSGDWVPSYWHLDQLLTMINERRRVAYMDPLETYPTNPGGRFSASAWKSAVNQLVSSHRFGYIDETTGRWITYSMLTPWTYTGYQIQDEWLTFDPTETSNWCIANFFQIFNKSWSWTPSAMRLYLDAAGPGNHMESPTGHPEQMMSGADYNEIYAALLLLKMVHVGLGFDIKLNGDNGVNPETWCTGLTEAVIGYDSCEDALAALIAAWETCACNNTGGADTPGLTTDVLHGTYDECDPPGKWAFYDYYTGKICEVNKGIAALVARQNEVADLPPMPYSSIKMGPEGPKLKKMGGFAKCWNSLGGCTGHPCRGWEHSTMQYRWGVEEPADDCYSWTYGAILTDLGDLEQTLSARFSRAAWGADGAVPEPGQPFWVMVEPLHRGTVADDVGKAWGDDCEEIPGDDPAFGAYKSFVILDYTDGFTW